MIQIEKKFFKDIEQDGVSEDVNEFFRSILIEAATENYRQLMYEALTLTEDRTLLDPPLRANERVMSGLFSNAIAKVSARSRPEARIDHELEQDADDGDDDTRTRAGRVDFLAWYSNKTIAIELKVAGINLKTGELTELIKKRWSKVVWQADSAQKFLMELAKTEEHRYPSPVAIALMVLIARSVDSADDTDVKVARKKITDVDAAREKILESVASTNPSPDFVATYQFPEEFRTFVRKKKGREAEGKVSTPFVVFLGYRAK